MLSPSLGLGIGTHSRKHTLVSPRGQGVRERLSGRAEEEGGHIVTGYGVPGQCEEAG